MTRPVNIEKVWSNGFVLFRCEPGKQGPAKPAVRRPLEIKKVLWLAPEEFENYSWRFPEQMRWLKQWLSEAARSSD